MALNLPHSSPAARYGLALCAVAAAFGLRALFDPLLREAAEFFLFTLAVVLGAWRGGLGPGLFATALSAVAISVFFAPPYHRPLISDDKDIFGVALFTLSGGVISWLSERRLREERARQEASRKVGDILSSITDSFYSLDRAWQFTDVNERAAAHFGRRREELLGRAIWEVFPEMAESEFDRQSRRAVAEGVPAHFETASRVAAGTWVEVHAYPSEAGLSVYFRDITERKRIEAEREEARARAEAANRAKDEFIALVSHELRNPLNSIIGWLDILRRHPGDGSLIPHALNIIERSARAQLQLTEDLLDAARIAGGKLTLNVETVDLAAVARAAVDVVRPAAEAKAILLSSHLQPDAGPVTGDPHRLQQVVWNLLSNAIKFTPKGGHVEISLRREGENARLTVSDTGKGIKPALLPYVFDRFRQDDGAGGGRHEGIGIGLSLARHLVELHGGAVEAESEGEGKGASFTVTLPLKSGAARSAGARRQGY
jgi:PAS domain S-box-containing protein